MFVKIVDAKNTGSGTQENLVLVMHYGHWRKTLKDEENLR